MAALSEKEVRLEQKGGSHDCQTEAYQKQTGIAEVSKAFGECLRSLPGSMGAELLFGDGIGTC